MKMMRPLCLTLVLALLGVADGQNIQTADKLPQHDVESSAVLCRPQQAARHIILMIGDGMGAEQVWAAWACNGGKLNIGRLPVCGWSRSSSASHAITDSAAGGTAIACGKRTSNGTVGQSPKGKAYPSLAASLRLQGYATGLVVTKSITDATPASFYAHAKSRDDTALIASQLPAAGFSVVLGGGSEDVPAAAVERMRAAGALVELAAPKNMPDALQRGDYLPRATQRALERLGKDDAPFFLMVEGSMIDVAAHDRDLKRLAAEVLDFDRALGVVLRWAQTHPDALIIVTADHQTGGLTIHDADADAGRVRGSFATSKHTGLAVPVYAGGAGAQNFAGIYDNRNIRERVLHACTSPKSGKSE